MSLTLELPADILAELNAEVASRGTSPKSIHAETLAERKARFAEDEAAYREWWDSQSPEEQRALNAKWEASSLATEQGRHVSGEVLFARLRARHASVQPHK